MSKKRVYSENEVQLMIAMYKDGETYTAISKILHTKSSTVSSYLKSLGYGRRPLNTLKHHEYLSASRKNMLNESYFETIDTESKAYWLGFLFADGCVRKIHDKNGRSKGGSVELTLKAADKYHIQNFLDDISSNAPISDKEVTLNGNKYLAVRTVVSSIKMVTDLIKQGCVENKSLVLVPPSNIPDELVHHFVRGYFDGDGCVAFYPQRYGYRYSVLGTKEILQYIIEQADIKDFSAIRDFEHKKCFELIIQSKAGVEKFHNYIYSDKTIYLERKYQKSLGMMKFTKQEDGRNDTQKLADLLGDDLILDDCLMENFECCFYKRSETAAMADLLD